MSEDERECVEFGNKASAFPGALAGAAIAIGVPAVNDGPWQIARLGRTAYDHSGGHRGGRPYRPDVHVFQFGDSVEGERQGRL